MDRIKTENNTKRVDNYAYQYDREGYKEKLQNLRKRAKIFDTTPREPDRVRISPNTNTNTNTNIKRT